jgi:hypothetical protein
VGDREQVLLDFAEVALSEAQAKGQDRIRIVPAKAGPPLGSGPTRLVHDRARESKRGE